MHKKYTHPTHSLSSISIDSRFSDLQELRSFLDNRLIFTKNTRLDRYQQYLKFACEHGIESFDPKKIFKNVIDNRFRNNMDWYLYVLREVDELMFILRGLKHHEPNGVNEKLKKIVAGSDFAFLDKNTESRNTQFELRIASYFCLAGFSVDLSSETDIIAKKGFQQFYIECKRISNNKQLEENLLKAKQQLLIRMPKNGILRKNYGVIAADVTKAAYKQNGLTMGITNEHVKDTIQDSLKKISNEIKHINFFSEKPKIILCWLQIHIPGIILIPQQVFTRFSSLYIENNSIFAKCWRALIILRKTTGKANLTDPRESPPDKINQQITIPIGSKLWLTPDINELFQRASSSKLHEKLFENDVNDDCIDIDIDFLSKEIGGLTIQNINYNFTVCDLILFLYIKPIEERERLYSHLFQNGKQEDAVQLLLMMFFIKYPYYTAK